MRRWVHGLVAAFLGGVGGALSSGVTLMLVDPADFNLDTGFKKLAISVAVIALLSGIQNAAFYLKNAPDPWDGVDRRGERNEQAQ